MALYGGPFLDPHHHLWDLSKGEHPWLVSDGGLEALPGISRIAKDYLVEDYRRDAGPDEPVATVHVEALWAGDPVGETEWLETLEKSDGVARRYVAGAPLGTRAAAGILIRQAAFPRVTAVRGILSWHPDPAKCFVADPDLGSNTAWLEDVARLAPLGLGLELMLYPYQAATVSRIASTFPDLSITLNHCGSPIDRDREGMRRWADGLRLLAACPNVSVKVSNPGAYDPIRSRESIGQVVSHCIECFGVSRSMFGTDYPVAAIWMPYAEIMESYRHAVSDLSPEEQRALFHDNAQRHYAFDVNWRDGPGR